MDEHIDRLLTLPHVRVNGVRRSPIWWQGWRDDAGQRHARHLPIANFRRRSQ